MQFSQPVTWSSSSSSSSFSSGGSGIGSSQFHGLGVEVRRSDVYDIYKYLASDPDIRSSIHVITSSILSDGFHFRHRNKNLRDHVKERLASHYSKFCHDVIHGWILIGLVVICTSPDPELIGIPHVLDPLCLKIFVKHDRYNRAKYTVFRWVETPLSQEEKCALKVKKKRNGHHRAFSDAILAFGASSAEATNRSSRRGKWVKVTDASVVVSDSDVLADGSVQSRVQGLLEEYRNLRALIQLDMRAVETRAQPALFLTPSVDHNGAPLSLLRQAQSSVGGRPRGPTQLAAGGARAVGGGGGGGGRSRANPAPIYDFSPNYPGANVSAGGGAEANRVLASYVGSSTGSQAFVSELDAAKDGEAPLGMGGTDTSAIGRQLRKPRVDSGRPPPDTVFQTSRHDDVLRELPRERESVSDVKPGAYAYNVMSSNYAFATTPIQAQSPNLLHARAAFRRSVDAALQVPRSLRSSSESRYKPDNEMDDSRLKSVLHMWGSRLENLINRISIQVYGQEVLHSDMEFVRQYLSPGPPGPSAWALSKRRRLRSAPASDAELNLTNSTAETMAVEIALKTEKADDLPELLRERHRQRLEGHALSELPAKAAGGKGDPLIEYLRAAGVVSRELLDQVALTLAKERKKRQAERYMSLHFAGWRDDDKGSAKKKNDPFEWEVEFSKELADVNTRERAIQMELMWMTDLRNAKTSELLKEQMEAKEQESKTATQDVVLETAHVKAQIELMRAKRELQKVTEEEGL